MQFQNFERGFQSFAFHPDFNRRGAPGYGKIYTYVDTSNVTPTPDWTPTTPGAKVAHHAVLLEWTAKNPAAATYDGDAPRELMRWHRPFVNHNGGQLGFNPTARRGSADYGLLYAGNADGGAGGDPMNMAQNLASTFGKILRIDPLGKNSANGKYGIPKDNPFVNDNDPNTLGEILRVRRAQSSAVRVGLEDADDVHGRHRPGHRRGSDDGSQRREPRLARVGRQPQVRQRLRSEPRDPAQRSEGDLSRRRVRAARSAAAEQLSGDDGICVPAQPVEGAQEPALVR